MFIFWWLDMKVNKHLLWRLVFGGIMKLMTRKGGCAWENDSFKKCMSLKAEQMNLAFLDWLL